MDTGYFGVRASHWQGVCASWDECMARLKGAANARYKWFDSLEAAQLFAGTAPTEDGVPAAGECSPTSASPDTEPDSLRCVVSPPCTYTLLLRDGSRHDIRDMPLAPVAGASATQLVVYTDGSSLWNGKDNARAGVGVYFGPDDPRNVSEPLPGPRQSSQRAELAAIVLALLIINNDPSLDWCEKIRICTDSMHGIGSLTKWHTMWESNGWRHAGGAPVEDRDLIEAGVDCIRSAGRTVEFTHVRGHIGIEGNVQADRLAVDAAHRNKIQRCRDRRSWQT
ncbi:hypothetical protein IWQ57_002278 [Coemansia nantahalensis]|uniref:Uncharacterized protein n=1 Tax=Coemansia nantahalensis TaxID=2789366 RepID=A0ACC1K1T7_9FUNG|nr:hypothetical protein IWQ57_002278 [Coemansia nantahalensis]